MLTPFYSNRTNNANLMAESSTAQREETLKNLRIWLDGTHFDHLRREKQWQEGTCEWIMRKEIFNTWLEDGTGAFWIFGIPGNFNFRK
jgi:hypothetical protein